MTNKTIYLVGTSLGMEAASFCEARAKDTADSPTAALSLFPDVKIAVAAGTPKTLPLCCFATL